MLRSPEWFGIRAARRSALTVTMLLVAGVSVLPSSAAAASPLTATGSDTPIVVAAGQSIQAAIDGADSGAEIVVEPGTYVEHVDFRGKDLAVRSAGGPSVTVIDGGGKGPVVRFTSGETRDARLQGFTVRGGARVYDNWHYIGGGVWIDGSSPTIKGNIVEDNTFCDTGAIGAEDGSPIIEENIVRDNKSEGCQYPTGGGIYIGGDGPGTAVIRSNLIERNIQHMGAGIGLGSAGEVRIENNIIRNNRALTGGSALEFSNRNILHVVGNVMVDNYGNTAIYGSIPTGAPNYGAALYLLNNTIARNEGTVVDVWGPGAAFAGNVLVAPPGSPILICRGPIDTAWEMTDTIVWNSQSAPLYEGAPLYRDGTWTPAPCGIEPGTSGVVEADPQFVDGEYSETKGKHVLPPGDFRLRPTSPGVEKGFTGYGAGWLPDTDAAGMPRISDADGDGTAVIDMGAYEILSATPGPPTQMTAQGGIGHAELSWRPPIWPGNSAVIGYTVTMSPGGRTYDLNADAASLSVTNLNEGTDYKFEVRAVNAAGASALPATRHLQGTRLSISSKNITLGDETTVTGTLTDAKGSALSGAVVVVDGRKKGTTTWAPVTTRTTDASGRYSFVVRPAWSNEYRATYSSDSARFPASAIGTVGVRQVVAGYWYDNTVRRGETARFYGTVDPYRQGQAMYLQRLSSSGSWLTVSSTTLTRYGTYNFYRKTYTVGTFKYRAYRPANSDYASAYTPARTLYVR